ncbi:5'/3'-nucleotidase SurE, partial [Pseudanabaenaceae cyanobacterium LEGE 13415]|nr:5'/3'-nucleotidase SurE [Pseudanabaenaceae cyanobacterium LEGE 13415]
FAISQYKKGRIPIDWERSTRLAANVLKELIDRPYESGYYWNVNLPYVEPDAPDPEIIFCEPCTQPLPSEFRIEGDELYYCGNYAARKRDRGSDVDVCLSGQIAITYLKV